ncbi:MAG TPA: sulfate/molybdate ABC transporter ATP-binding protein [Stellaceae bacterium]
MSIEIAGLSKHFGAIAALDRIDLSIKDREFLAMLGPSGSGKTTLLRVIAGLEAPDEGALAIDGRDALDLPPRERRIGFVFQHYALFRHMRVADNVAFGLRIKPPHLRPSRRVIAERVRELLALVQLDGLGDRFPAQLSGGQRQRVALARALAVEPRVLLLDEPFGALDTKVRVELRRWLRTLHDRLGLTSVFVTHDQEEALELADRVAILNAGRIEQTGAPREIYDRPATAFVTGFLGEVNRLPCRVENGIARFADAALDVPKGLCDGEAFAFVRPHEIDLVAAHESAAGTAVVRALSVIGPRTRIHLDHGDHVLEADAERAAADALGLAPGVRVGIRFRTVRFYPKANGEPAAGERRCGSGG